MGRCLKRVPIDFKWPLHQVWVGYLNPYSSVKCKSCDGTGLNPATKKIRDDWYDPDRTGVRWCNNITQDEVDALWDENRLHRDFKEKPTAQQVNEWSKHGFGHDSINHYICYTTRAKRLGVYGYCEYCGGDGELWQSDEIKALHDNWDGIEPPTGDGFQLWETTSEGSPTSPVFETLEALCEWCEANATTFASYTATKDEWWKMLNDDFVCHESNGVVFI